MDLSWKNWIGRIAAAFITDPPPSNAPVTPAEKVGRGVGLTLGFLEVSLHGWRLFFRRARSSPAPRRATHRYLVGLSNVFIAFGAAFLILGGTIRLSRQAELSAAERQYPTPSFAGSVQRPTAPSSEAAGGAPADIGPVGTAPILRARIHTGPAGSPADETASAHTVSAHTGPATTGPATTGPSHTGPANTGRIERPPDDTRAAESTVVRAPPDRIVIPSLSLDAPVQVVGWTRVMNGDDPSNVWETANYAAGFHKTSAPPGDVGNTVLSGHNNILGSVFKELHNIEPGEKIYLYAGEKQYAYQVELNFVVKEAGATLEERRENARWIEPTDDARLTLVTCYPPWSNTHRTVVVARPVDADPLVPDESIVPSR